MNIYRKPTYYATSVCLTLALAGRAHAQFGTEQYDHAQFCDREVVEKAAPGRATIIYLDAYHIRQEAPSGAAPSRAGTEDHSREQAARYRKADWYAQLEGKLGSSLLPSETVSVVLVFPDRGRTEQVAEFCWPGYGEARNREMDDAGVLSALFTADPRQYLDQQRSVFFGDIRLAVAEALGEAETLPRAAELEYVRALSMDEGRLGGKLLGKPVRVIAYGGFLEQSGVGTIAESPAPEDMARQAVRRFGYNARGAAFHFYGAPAGETGENAAAFWGEFLHEAEGYLMSFGPDLSASGQMPAWFATLELDVSMRSPNDDRKAVLGLGIGETGELIDSNVVVAGQHLSGISGIFSCDDPVDACRTTCVMKAEVARPVLFEGARKAETLELRGNGADLRGTIGVEGTGDANVFEVHGGLVEC